MDSPRWPCGLVVGGGGEGTVATESLIVAQAWPLTKLPPQSRLSHCSRGPPSPLASPPGRGGWAQWLEPRAALAPANPQPSPSPQYGKKKRRYLPYHRQHLYFFLSEWACIGPEMGAQRGRACRPSRQLPPPPMVGSHLLKPPSYGPCWPLPPQSLPPHPLNHRRPPPPAARADSPLASSSLGLGVQSSFLHSQHGAPEP